MVATASHDHTARLWDANTGDNIRVFEGHTDAVRSVAFAPDGSRIITGSKDGSAKLWDATNGYCMRTYQVSARGATAVAFSPDASMILIGGADEANVKLWHIATDSLVRVFNNNIHGSEYPFEVNAVKFSSDGKTILTAGQVRENAFVLLWDVADLPNSIANESMRDGNRDLVYHTVHRNAVILKGLAGSSAEHVTLTIFAANGRIVSLYREMPVFGNNITIRLPKSIASGAYIFSVVQDGHCDMRRFIVGP
jgi:WD40 repeat protein